MEAETADVSTVVDNKSDVSAEEVNVSVEETNVSLEESTTVEEVAPSSSVVDAKEVNTEVSVEASEVTVVDMVAEVTAEVVVTEANFISVLNQSTLSSINTHEACRGLRLQSQWPIG